MKNDDAYAVTFLIGLILGAGTIALIVCNLSVAQGTIKSGHAFFIDRSVFSCQVVYKLDESHEPTK